MNLANFQTNLDESVKIFLYIAPVVLTSKAYKSVPQGAEERGLF